MKLKEAIDKKEEIKLPSNMKNLVLKSLEKISDKDWKRKFHTGPYSLAKVIVLTYNWDQKYTRAIINVIKDFAEKRGIEWSGKSAHSFGTGPMGKDISGLRGK